MLKILTDDSLFLIEKPIRIYKQTDNLNLLGIKERYYLIIQDDKKYELLILSSNDLEVIDRAYKELCKEIIYRDNNIKTDLFFNFTNYK
ncbi:hypothetical protein OFR22_13085 [Brachyspira hyodysenteriae]|uniref:hypothetical protein n=1 Tax=Brachyspira hyodysenteriae TaxID=159 RepID=UPI0022CD8299|nr:hypothetical protein [Brachyspira hyodysenteriae]MCZ9840578.1 hypothetical protein [Brachyspira hyodysenteriae]MCZ9849664.1 hypothetical protein [Brachyspira hyodysenteriae]MCZ9851545.1 hypothetical protein [Brachyspira hyodysenteriae]MCZ9859715.1 hypothetical protein [Brachyspira hyodysenteriae]MCZ9870319.1 hypothetical protein [Brachyspira hyodysenteriae]